MALGCVWDRLQAIIAGKLRYFVPYKCALGTNFGTRQSLALGAINAKGGLRVLGRVEVLR